MAIKEWVQGKKTATLLGLIMGGLTIFVVVFGSYKLYRRKIRQRNMRETVTAQQQDGSDIELANFTRPPVHDDNAFGIVALERGIYGGVPQTSGIARAPPETSIDNVIAARKAARKTNTSTAPPSSTIALDFGDRAAGNSQAREGQAADTGSTPARTASTVTRVQPSSLTVSPSLRDRYLGIPAFSTFITRRRRASEISAQTFPSEENGRSVSPASAMSLTPPPTPGISVLGGFPEITLQDPRAHEGVIPKVYDENEHQESGDSGSADKRASVKSLGEVYELYGSDIPNDHAHGPSAPPSESGEAEDQGLEIHSHRHRRTFSRMPSRAML